MGIADRDYTRRAPPSGYGGGFGPGMRGGTSWRTWSVTTWLIIINVSVFFLDTVFAQSGVGLFARAEQVRGVNGRQLTAPSGKAVETGPVLVMTQQGPKPASDVSGIPVNTLGFKVLVDSEDRKLVVGERGYRYLPPLRAVGYFSTDTGFIQLQVWRLITFQFLHANLGHLFFNMLGLFIFGRWVEEHLGRKRYAAFYLMTGLCGGLLYLILNLAGVLNLNLPGALGVGVTTQLVGASAGVFGVIMACAYIAPNAMIQLLIPPIPLRMKVFAYGYVAFAAANLLIFQGNNQGGDAAHVGGAIAGWYFIRNTHLLRDFFDVLDNSNLPRKATQPRDRRHAGRAPKQSEIDRILAKVSDKGLQSLTPAEKNKLERASRLGD